MLHALPRQRLKPGPRAAAAPTRPPLDPIGAYAGSLDRCTEADGFLARRKQSNIDLCHGPPPAAKCVSPPSRRIVRGLPEANPIERVARLHQVPRAAMRRRRERLPWE